MHSHWLDWLLSMYDIDYCSFKSIHNIDNDIVLILDFTYVIDYMRQILVEMWKWKENIIFGSFPCLNLFPHFNISYINEDTIWKFHVWLHNIQMYNTDFLHFSNFKNERSYYRIIYLHLITQDTCPELGIFASLIT